MHRRTRRPRPPLGDDPALVGSSLPDGVSIFPLGERRLKDIDEPERVFELEIDGVARSSSPVEAARRPTRTSGATDLGKRMAERIEASVRRSVEASLARATSGSTDADRASSGQRDRRTAGGER